VAGRLVAAGAEGIVLGCTEVPLVLEAGSLAVPVFDVVLILARAAIVAAGREPTAEGA
jgi:aspartate racemase